MLETVKRFQSRSQNIKADDIVKSSLKSKFYEINYNTLITCNKISEKILSEEITKDKLCTLSEVHPLALLDCNTDISTTMTMMMQEYNSFITYLKGIERSLMSSDSEVVRYSSSEDTNYAKYKDQLTSLKSQLVEFYNNQEQEHLPGNHHSLEDQL